MSSVTMMTCDLCGRVMDSDAWSVWVQNGGYQVRREYGKTDVDLCSLECLVKWVANEVAEAGVEA